MKKSAAYIYVVDDDASVCTAVSLLLKANGYNAECFPCAEDFLNLKRPKKPACLILDISLPNINGLALQDALAERKISVPIIFITGHGDIPMSVRAMKAGAVDFLPKPFTEDKLLKAVAIAVSRNKVQNKSLAEIAKIKKRVKTLSPRELEVFRFVARGLMSKEIAGKRGISLQTIKVHRGRVMHKMKAATVTELIDFARITGIIPSQK